MAPEPGKKVTCPTISMEVDDKIRHHLQDMRMVLVDPYLLTRNLFVAHFLTDANARLWWVDCSQQVESLETFLNVLIEEVTIDDQNPSQPVLLADTLETTAHNLAKWFQSILVDSTTYLFIEAVDAADPVIELFLATFAQVHPAHLQTCLIARAFDLRIWKDAIQNKDAMLLTEVPDEALTNVLEQPLVRAMAFSGGQVIVNGSPMQDWGRKYSDELQRLFWYIIDRTVFSLDDVVETLYPEQTTRAASRHFKQLLKRLNERLSNHIGGTESYTLLRTVGPGIYAASGDVYRCYDVQHFEDAWEQAQIVPNRQEYLLRMLRLHRAPYLYSYNTPEIRARRETLLGRYAQALQALIPISGSDEDMEKQLQALGTLLRAIRANPLREDLYREAMDLYDALGEANDALNLYNILRRRVTATSPQTEAVYQKILQRLQDRAE